MKLPTRLLATAAALLFTTSVAAAATVVANTDVNLRSGPGVQYPVIAVIPDGAAVNATGCGGGWCHVDYRGRVGWASRVYLTSAIAAAPYYYSYSYTEPYNAEPYYYDYYGPFGFAFGPAFAYDGDYFSHVTANNFRYPTTRFFRHHVATLPAPVEVAAPHGAGAHIAAAHLAAAPHSGGVPHVGAAPHVAAFTGAYHHR